MTVVLSQSSFYYYRGVRVPLKENPLVRYVCLDNRISDEEVAFVTRQLENYSWRVDKYDSLFGKYFVNSNDLNDFLSVVSQYNSEVILHTPNYATIDTDSFYPVRQVLVKNSSDISVDYLLSQLNIPCSRCGCTCVIRKSMFDKRGSEIRHRIHLYQNKTRPI